MSTGFSAINVQASLVLNQRAWPTCPELQKGLAEVLDVGEHRAPKPGDALVMEVSTEHGTKLLDATRKALPFSLTEAQDRVIGEVVADMSKPLPMMRLLQVR